MNKSRIHLLKRIKRMGFRGCLFCFIGIFRLFGISSVGSQDLVVSWGSNEEPDLVGYKVYYGKASRIYDNCVDAGMTTEYVMSISPDTGTVFFAVTAYNEAGNESNYSQEVSINLDESYRQNFSLLANYPNPFNPVTQIPYSLTKNLSIDLAVYDILGRLVKFLVEGDRDAGMYEVVWDGTDESGIRVANGIYFCRLIVGDFCQTKKLILMR